MSSLLTVVDLPFALPTAVAGIALTAIYAKNGWLGEYLERVRLARKSSKHSAERPKKSGG